MMPVIMLSKLETSMNASANGTGAKPSPKLAATAVAMTALHVFF